MGREEELVTELCGKFPILENRVHVQGEKRIFTEALTRDEFEQIIRFAHDEMGLFRAHTVIGTDDGYNLGFIYLLSGEDSILLALRESVPKANPEIQSVADLYPSIVMHERELVDLFGAIVLGLPAGPSYPLPDGWPKGNYPLRKEWNPQYFDRQTMTYQPPKPKETEE